MHALNALHALCTGVTLPTSTFAGCGGRAHDNDSATLLFSMPVLQLIIVTKVAGLIKRQTGQPRAFPVPSMQRCWCHSSNQLPGWWCR